jgi:hypothetical protein
MTEFFKKHVVGAIIFALVTGLAVNFIYDRVKAPKNDRAMPKSETDALLDGCYSVPPTTARFVVLPTSPTGTSVPDFTLRFTGVLGDKVAVTRYEVLREGIEKGALKIYRGKYTLILANPATRETITSLTGTGLNAFDVEKRHLDDVLVAFVIGIEWPKIDWTNQARTPALSGRCNLLNLVLLQ